MPGTPEDPGAREAGVVIYIDTMLSYNEGFPESTYREPPYAQMYDGETPPESDAPFETVWVSADEMERYGYQSVLSPREVYRLGIVAVDAYASSKFSRRFIELSESEQDEIVGAMADGTAEAGFDQIAAESFFRVLLGYPGAQRAYTESDIRAEHTPHRPPQSLAMMHAFSPGQYAGEHVVLPVSGSNEDYPVHHDHP
jgi:gluconate 2-dehydrogenase gamma chain